MKFSLVGEIPVFLAILAGLPFVYTSSSTSCSYQTDDTSGLLQIVADRPIEGFVTSPNYPNGYPPNQDCVYRIEAPPNSGLVIHLDFVDIDLAVGAIDG